MKKLGFGWMRLPVTDENDQAGIDIKTVEKMVDAFLENGFTYCDTAYMYHAFKSEVSVREALVKRHRRDGFTLATKMPMALLKSKEEQEGVFSEQMEKCGVDYFDYYLLHSLNISTYKKALDYDSFAFIQKKKDAGKIRHIGFSYHDNAELLDEILTAHPEMEFVQLQLNYLDWDNEGIQSRKCYEVARKHNKPVIVMEPLRGGTLAVVPEKVEKLFKGYNPDMSAASWALRFAASHEGIMVVLSGMSNMGQMLDNIKTMKDFQPFTPEELDIMEKAVGVINESIAVPCTSCRYCTEGCPKQIDIPRFFALYNAEKRSPNKLFSIQKNYYDSYTRTHAKASECIDCKQCERICPQHIDITYWLKKTAEVFEPAS